MKASLEPTSSKNTAPHQDVLPVPLRFVTAASLFDGHDASINIIRRILVSRGVEVIHLGHNQSAETIVRAAIQEDASGIAISSYQGGHVEFFRYVIDLLKQYDASSIRVFGGGGGTITPQELADLHKYGVERLYSPEDGRLLGLTGMIDDMIARTLKRAPSGLDWKGLTQFKEKEKALSQFLSCLELPETYWKKNTTNAKLFDQAKNLLSDKKFSSTVITLTGTGGAGKSSLTDELTLRVVEKFPQSKIAVLAFDPTRRKTGGALLGDRLRMNSVQNSKVYMRSFATRNQDGSLASVAKEAIHACKHAGFDWIFVETGGIGQADTSVVGLGDISLYVMTSEFGAPTQLEKINMLDFADVIVLNKFDKLGAQDALTEVRKAFRRNHRDFEKLPPETYPVFATRACRFADPGIHQLFDHLLEIQKSPEKRKALKTPFKIHEPNPIVPKNRGQYLSEISASIRSYHQLIDQEVQKISQKEALEQAIELVSKDSQSDLKSKKESIEASLAPETKYALKQYAELKKAYEGDQYQYQVRDKKFSVPLTQTSLSGQAIRKVSLPKYRSQADLLNFLMKENLPGYFPFTAGVFPFKRSEEDPKRQFAGEGPPERTNKRFHLLCDGEKAKRLSTAFDSVTLYGFDPDERPDIFGKIGESGVSICTLDDMKKLYHGFDLCDPSTSVSMTINGPAPMLLSFFFNTAIDQQIEKFQKEKGKAPSDEERKKLEAFALASVRGTVQADILKEDQAQNTCIFSTEFALKMMGDIQEYFIEHQIKNYYSVSISGYHIAEAGANPISQLAFTLANGFTYLEYYKSRGMKVDDFAPNFSFFFSNGLDPEYTVIGRVARRIWAVALKRLYGTSERSQKLKYHIQTSGRSLHAQEISFNDIRTTLQALLAYYDNCNSLHTNAYDEAVTTPTEESVRRAMAIQLIITKEFGWAKNENPHQGSFFVEELTQLVEEAVLAEFDRISERGGVLGAMETQYQRSKIQEESLHYETLKHSGELPIIGVNTYLNTKASGEEAYANPLTRASYEEKNHQIKTLKKFQATHEKEATQALKDLKDAAVQGKNIFAQLMKTSRVCSLGQMTRALFSVGGQYRRSM